jgi:glutamyl-tRNA reductase
MFNDLVLIHRRGGQSGLLQSPVAKQIENSFFLPTCLRQVAVFPEDQFESVASALSESDELYRGRAAYQFFLEVICGLQSPLIGETEIFGQFKNAMSALSAAQTPMALKLRRFLNALNEDAKRIRGLHLKDLGSQSYGSLLRRELKGIKQIHIIGAGQLVKDILPWICKDGAKVIIHARDIEKAKANLSDFPNILFAEGPAFQTQSEFSGAVIVAAPIEATVLNQFFNHSFELIVDLRADSHEDVLATPIRTLVLRDLFERISRNQEQLQERKNLALKDISNAVLAREQYVEYRPFGWDDVCA